MNELSAMAPKRTPELLARRRAVAEPGVSDAEPQDSASQGRDAMQMAVLSDAAEVVTILSTHGRVP